MWAVVVILVSVVLTHGLPTVPEPANSLSVADTHATIPSEAEVPKINLDSKIFGNEGSNKDGNLESTVALSTGSATNTNIPMPFEDDLKIVSTLGVSKYAKPAGSVLDFSEAYHYNEPQCPGGRRNRLLVAVITAPAHSRARDAIRTTWAKTLMEVGGDRITVQFFVGKLSNSVAERESLEQELSHEQGIVRLDTFVENYHNLTAKSLAVFTYGYRNCYAGVLKIDDDVFLKADRILPFLDRFDWERLYSGLIMQNMQIYKNPQGRWYAYDQYPHETWPDFANGPCYFLGLSALKFISENERTLPLLRMEDVSVAVWVNHLSLNKVYMPNAHLTYNIGDDAIWITPVNYNEMYRLNSGEVFSLQVCDPNVSPDACLCGGSPFFSPEESANCWEREGNSPYQDSIPR